MMESPSKNNGDDDNGDGDDDGDGDGKTHHQDNPPKTRNTLLWPSQVLHKHYKTR